MRRIIIAVLVGLLLWGAAASAADIGSSREFSVNDGYDEHSRDSLTATLRAEGAQAYFFVDDSYWDGLSSSTRTQYAQKLAELSDEWDRLLWPKITALWGVEDRPGIDGDSKAVVLLEDLRSGSGGYFQTVNMYPKTRASESNEAEMVFVSAESVQTGLANAYLSHEFQHLISFTNTERPFNVEEDTWLNEARSEYSITAAGLSDPFAGSALERRLASFLRSPSNSVVGWTNTATDYAAASVFAHYLADRFTPAILADTAKSRQIGIPSLDDWLLNRGAGTFPNIFGDYMAALVLNDRSAGSQYAFTTRGLDSFTVRPTEHITIRAGSDRRFTVSAEDWQPFWLEVAVDDTTALPQYATVEVTGEAGDTWYGAVAALYGSTQRVSAFTAAPGRSLAQVPTDYNGQPLKRMIISFAQGYTGALGNDEPVTRTAEAVLSLGEAEADLPVPTQPAGDIRDGDLIRRPGQAEVYVVWGKYRRYLMPGVLELYGFQNRSVREVADDIFNRYTTSNYIRADGTEPVYAVWPDGTKHWFNITAAQWDATGRDWGAIFIVNPAEAAFYAPGADITR